MKKLIKKLAKSVLIPLGIIAAWATDAAIQKNFAIRDYTDNFKRRNRWYHEIINSLEYIGLMIQSFSKTIKNETREQKERFF